MRRLWICFAFLSAVGFAFAACSDPLVVGGSTSGASNADGGSCRDILWSYGPCSDCGYDKCCAEINACAATLNCLKCAYWGPWNRPLCDEAFDAAMTLRTCMGNFCGDTCAPIGADATWWFTGHEGTDGGDGSSGGGGDASSSGAASDGGSG